jgi:hypothetical protein
MFAVYIQFDNQAKSMDDLSQDELLAYNQTVEAFNLLASKFNKGTKNVEVLTLMSTALDKGTENVAYLGAYTYAQNKIFKKQ